MNKDMGTGKVQTILLFSLGLYTACLVIANVLASKLFVIDGRFVVTAGIIAYPITFVVTDMINEVWGKSMARKFVWIGLTTNIMMVLLFSVGVKLPSASIYTGQESFASVLGSVPKMVVASMLGYLASQLWDVWVFNFIKEKFKWGLWFRANFSTVTGQAVDSSVFLLIAFGGSVPPAGLVEMLITYIIIKAVVALLSTPLCYMAVDATKKAIKKERIYE